MGAKNTAARIGGRTAAGLAGLVAVVVVVGGVLTVPLSSAAAKPASTTVTPVPADTRLACTGPLLRLTSGSSTASLETVGDPEVVSGGGATANHSTLAASGVTSSDGAAAQSFTATATKGAKSAPLLAAAQSESTTSSDLSGFAATGCNRAGYDQWMVGGSTAIGQTSLVVLSNPSGVATTVDLAVYTEQGQVQASGARAILVQAHGQRVVPLAGVAPNASATVLRVTSTGAPVAASLEQYRITGITPQGADWVGPTAAPSTHLVIPGAVIAAAAQAQGSDDGDDATPILRVMPSGGSDAKLTVGMKAEAGSTGGGATSATASHGKVSEIPLDKLEHGDFTVTIDSNVPIVAAVRAVGSDATDGTDFAWYPATVRLSGTVVLPVAAGPGATVHFANSGRSAVSFTVGATKITVPAGGATALSVPNAPTVLTAKGLKGVRASVSYSGSGQLAGYAVYPADAGSPAVTVYRR